MIGRQDRQGVEGNAGYSFRANANVLGIVFSSKHNFGRKKFNFAGNFRGNTGGLGAEIREANWYQNER